MEALLTLTWHEARGKVLDAVTGDSCGADRVVVAARLPLLADMTVADNIALPRQYHLGVATALARLQAREYVARLLPAACADLFPEALTPAETFAVLWLRAISVPGRTVVLESPLASFDLEEAALQESVARCYGLFRRAYAHELRTARIGPQGAPQ
jgi:ABC-type arginine transport system ATPase subunit